MYHKINKTIYIYVYSLFICFATHNIYGQNTTINIDSYDIKANYNYEKKNIDITANLKIEKTENVNFFKILLSLDASIKSIKAENIAVKFSRIPIDDDTLFITIPELFKKKDKLNLSFEYTLPIDSLTFNNVIMLRREVRWYPLQYDDIASMKLDIITPNNYMVFTVGDLINKKNINNNTEYIFENNNSASYALVITKPNTFNTSLTKNIENVNVNFYFTSADTAVNNKIIKEVCSSFLFYSKYIGSYKHKQLNIVEIPDDRIQFVQSLSALMLVGSPFISYYKLGYGDWPSHEVAHQWCGSGFYINSKTKGRWFFEESLNEYLKTLYIQNTMGNDTLKKQLKSYLELYNEIDKSKEQSILEITSVNTKECAYVIYQKGPLVVNKLKNNMGNESWDKFIKEIYNIYYGNFLTYDEFIKTLSKYDAKGNIGKEFNKWLSEVGYR